VWNKIKDFFVELWYGIICSRAMLPHLADLQGKYQAERNSNIHLNQRLADYINALEQANVVIAELKAKLKEANEKKTILSVPKKARRAKR